MSALAMNSEPENLFTFAGLDVSRETQARLAAYVDLLRKWNATVNLVSPSTLPDAWTRHILDSAQLWPLLPPGTERLADLGSGAGFPGLALAILGVPHVTLIESDQRKCAFMREAARVAEVSVTILSKRIESVSATDLPNGPAQVVTARALAPLVDLLSYASPLLAKDSVCVFLKGRTAADEVAAAQRSWSFQLDTVPSCTDPQGSVLRLSEIARAE